MAADVITYCLDKVTDYAQFERFCHDLMSLLGYAEIEPLGGFADKGRDAIHVGRATGETTVFAYSVREDWRKKLEEDAAMIHEHGHPCDRLVFLSTATFTATERDAAVLFVRNTYGWSLEMYGVEHLRVQLAGPHSELIGKHPQIFPPSIFPKTPASLPGGNTDLLFLDYADADQTLAVWLARRLTGEGYRVWCRSLSLLGGEAAADTQERIIRNYTFRVITLYSRDSLRSPDVQLRRSLALSVAGERQCEFLIPVATERLTEGELDWKTRGLHFVRFDQGWAAGLRQLLKTLEAVNCPRPLDDGRSIAALTLLDDDVLGQEPETVYSNVLEVQRIPQAIHRFTAREVLTSNELPDLRRKWSFRAAAPGTFLSFHAPPSECADKHGLLRAGGACWQHVPLIDGIDSVDLVGELIRKSLLVECYRRGLRFCPEGRWTFFPPELLDGDRLRYRRPDGLKTFVNAMGQRKYWRPTGSDEYRYHLAPSFSVRRGITDSFVVLVRVRIRVTDLQGAPLPGRTAQSCRKHLCREWWNDEWLHRTLAVCQFLSDGADEIVIRDGFNEPLVVRAVPMHWKVPVSVNEGRLSRSQADREELLWSREDDLHDDESHDDRASWRTGRS